MQDCPICHMEVSEYFYVEMAYGQRLYVCGMNSGHRYEEGIDQFSHPAHLAVATEKYISWQL